MNAHMQMLNEYLDGSLDPYLEELLFAELSRNEQLRGTLRSHIWLQETAERDARSIQAPTQARTLLFERLGLSQANDIPLAATSAASATSTATSLATSSLSQHKGLLSFLMSSAFVVGLLCYHAGTLLIAQPEPTVMTRVQHDLQASPTSHGAVLKNSTPDNSLLLHPQSSTALAGRRLSTSSSTHDRSILDSPSISQQPQETLTVEAVSDGLGSENDLAFRSQFMNRVMATALSSVVVPSVAIAPFYLDAPYRLEFGSVFGASSQGSSLPDNLSLRLMVELDELYSLGVECSNGRYDLQRQQRIAGAEVLQHYTENRPTVSAVLRRSLMDLPSAELHSYAETAVGASASSDIALRAAAGIEWQPAGPLSLYSSVSYQMLSYNSSSTRRTSSAWGLQYGVALHF